MRPWSRTFRALVATALLGLIVLATTQPAQSATARRGNFSVVKKRGDAFRNYDMTEKTVSRNNVDWAVDLLFWNNAEVDKVKDALHDQNGYQGYPHEGGPQYARLKNNGGAYVWDEDKGGKTTECPGLPVGEPTDGYHYRIYATPGNDRMYNRVWGYYAFATTHIDHNECATSGTWFGESEDAEGFLARTAKEEWGSSRVDEDRRSFGNEEPFRREGNHIWRNDGKATYIKVP